MNTLTNIQLTHAKLDELQSNDNELLDLHIDTIERAFQFFLKYQGEDIDTASHLALIQDLELLRADLSDLRNVDCETEQHGDDDNE